MESATARRPRRPWPLHPGPSSLLAPRLPALLLVLLLVAGGGPAGADEKDEDAALRAELLQGRGDGEWRGVLENRVMKKDPAQVGRILGLLFSDPSLYEKNAACVAYTAAWLADHPVNGGREVLLAPYVLQRAYRDEEFLRRLEGHLTKYGGGRERLVEHAKRAAAAGSSEPLEARRAAVWFLSQERDPASRLDAIRFLHEQSVAGLGVPGGVEAAADPLALEVLDALRRLLDRRLTSLAEALQFLSQHPGASLVELLDARIQDPTEGEEADRARAIEYGTELIGLAQRPEDLLRFLDAESTPYLPLRQAAMRRALQLGPKAEEGWQRLLCVVLDQGEDPEVVRGALQVLEKVASDFRKAPERAEPIARCVVARLQRLGPESAAEDRARMAAILGRLGVAKAVLDAVSNERLSPRPAEASVLAELISATGEVEGGVPVEAILRHFREHPGDGPADRAIRRAVANALGLAGIASTQAEDAAAALRAILTGEGVEGIERETAPEVRELAIQRLQSYPGPLTASVLGTIADGRDDKEAEKALLVLGGHAGQGDADATRALAAVARGTSGEERRKRTIADLGALGPGATKEALGLAQEAVRAVLASRSETPALRAEAALAAARLGDAGSLAAMVEWWKEDPSRARVLADLVTAVVASGPYHDREVQDALIAVATAGGYDLAADVAKAIEESTPRVTLRLARALVLLSRARSPARDPKDRRKDLEQADATLATAAGSEVAIEKEEAILARLEVLKDLAAVQDPGPERTALLLRVIEDASVLQSRAVAERTGGLEEILAREPLDEAQAARFRRARERLESLRRS